MGGRVPWSASGGTAPWAHVCSRGQSRPVTVGSARGNQASRPSRAAHRKSRWRPPDLPMGGHWIAPRFRPNWPGTSDALLFVAARMGLEEPGGSNGDPGSVRSDWHAVWRGGAGGVRSPRRSRIGCALAMRPGWVAGGGAAAGGRVRGEDRGVGRSLARADPCRCRASAAGGDGLSGLGANHAPRGRSGEAPLASRAWAPHAAVGDRAGAVDAVGLRRRSEGRRALDGAVPCLAGLEPIPGHRSAVGPDDGVDGDGTRSRVAGVRGRADLRADRQRAHGLGRSRLRDRGRQPADRLGPAPLRADGRDVRPGRPGEQGSSEATVRVAGADLVPTEHNLRGE
jgi:hypothetical protein